MRIDGSFGLELDSNQAFGFMDYLLVTVPELRQNRIA
jgi:hypothetical protein